MESKHSNESIAGLVVRLEQAIQNKDDIGSVLEQLDNNLKALNTLSDKETTEELQKVLRMRFDTKCDDSIKRTLTDIQTQIFALMVKDNRFNSDNVKHIDVKLIYNYCSPNNQYDENKFKALLPILIESKVIQKLYATNSFCKNITTDALNDLSQEQLCNLFDQLCGTSKISYLPLHAMILENYVNKIQDTISDEDFTFLLTLLNNYIKYLTGRGIIHIDPRAFKIILSLHEKFDYQNCTKLSRDHIGVIEIVRDKMPKSDVIRYIDFLCEKNISQFVPKLQQKNFLQTIYSRGALSDITVYHAGLVYMMNQGMLSRDYLESHSTLTSFKNMLTNPEFPQNQTEEAQKALRKLEEMIAQEETENLVGNIEDVQGKKEKGKKISNGSNEGNTPPSTIDQETLDVKSKPLWYQRPKVQGAFCGFCLWAVTATVVTLATKNIMQDFPKQGFIGFMVCLFVSIIPFAAIGVAVASIPTVSSFLNGANSPNTSDDKSR